MVFDHHTARVVSHRLHHAVFVVDHDAVLLNLDYLLLRPELDRLDLFKFKILAVFLLPVRQSAVWWNLNLFWLLMQED